MFETPYVMKLAQGLARHSGARQAQIARNVANADTPGYRARDLADFSDAVARSDDRPAMRTTRPGHAVGQGLSERYATVDIGGPASPNGNNVSVEEELVRGTDAKSAHDLALTVYKSSLDVLRASLGRGR